MAAVAALYAQADRNPEKALAMANAFTNRADVVGEEALFLRGVLLFNGGQLLDAARSFEALLARFPRSNRADEIDGSLSADGHLYFYSDRPGGSGGYDLYRAPFQPEGDEFGEAINLGPLVNSPFNDYDPFVSRDGQRLFFSSNRHSGGSEEDYDLYVAVREADGSWGPPQRLPFNTTANEWEPALSADGLSLYFSSNRGGGVGGYDLWVSHFREGRWQEPVNLGPDINTSADELDPAVSEDGTEMLFGSNRDGGHGRFDIWSARRVLTAAP